MAIFHQDEALLPGCHCLTALTEKKSAFSVSTEIGCYCAAVKRQKGLPCEEDFINQASFEATSLQLA